MAGTVDLVLKWTLAIVYAAMGALMGSAFAFVAVKIVLLFIGTSALSAQAVQTIVIVATIISALLAAIGFLRQR
ncbi:hypothetical protein Sa4125_17940 [Aureimonas sp. SA4125]|uniref:hypothetical protein n=1 Tax=Aureimonas sp. SA4125 TaxID=2826993 RepID=UPI001CC6EF1B|nr:hypothetical protein [Aureimonas sp. SA4125]BDA84252.1 hypothetical protein Sa4125_17940 [Aureimonas sp. SA4125]